MLGSTGSIGTQTLEIASEQPDEFKAVALSAGRNINLLTEQVKTHKPEVVAIEDEKLVEDLKDKINNLDLNKKIRIKKNIKYINILNLYKNNDILISPSHNEPASVSIIEALSQGLPVISNDTSGTSLFIKNFYNGFRVNINNLNQTAEYIKYLSNSKNYNQMSNNAYEFSINNFSYSNSYNFFLKAIE